MATLRRRLGETAADPRYLRVIRRAEVKLSAPEESEDPPNIDVMV